MNQEENASWSIDGVEKSWTLKFASPELEKVYLGIRLNKAFNTIPRVICFLVCAGITARRIQLILTATYGTTVTTQEDEIRLLIITVTGMLFELCTFYFEKLGFMRCFSVVILIFYTAADSSVVYYQGRVRDEAVYAYTSYLLAGSTPGICFVLCYNWIVPTLAHIIGLGILVFYTHYFYTLTLSILFFLLTL